MSQPVTLFYSYAHQDEELRDQLATHLAGLRRQGFIEDWHDRHIHAGTAWEGQILAQLASAQLIVCLVSSDFIASDYCYTIEMPRALERHRAGEARVIPIVLRPCTWRETPLAELYVLPLDGKPVTQYADSDSVFTYIAATIKAVAEEIQQRRVPDAQTVDDLPSPSPLEPSAFVLETGAMPPDSVFYIQRRADRDAQAQLASPEPTVIIKGYRKSGKSSLLKRLHHDAQARGYRSAYLDLQSLSHACFASSEQLLRELAYTITDELNSSTDPDDVWLERRSAMRNVTRFIEMTVLAASDVPVQLIFDEADRVFSFPDCRTDFFAMLRFWHNRRASHEAWRKCHLVIAHSTDPALWISDLNQSPFNVGLPMTLDDFDEEQTAELNVLYGTPLRHAEDINRLTEWVGGHPYLVRLALYLLATEPSSLTELEHTAMHQDGPFASHLYAYLRSLIENADLKIAMQQILVNGTCDNEIDFQRLWSTGLIRGVTRQAASVRCRLYHDYFRSRL